MIFKINLKSILTKINKADLSLFGTFDTFVCNIYWDDNQLAEIRKSLRPQLYFDI